MGEHPVLSPELPASNPAPASAEGGLLAQRVGLAQSKHPGQSGFRLVSAGPEAYALRAYTAQLAVSTLDIQTYIWKADLTGRLLAGHVLQAAIRGVRVRILVDDLDARTNGCGLLALDAHPNVEVKVYNPPLAFSNWAGLNHRMHNKSWIADSKIALVGGRNLGDEYFDAHAGTNFVDLDFLMAGTVVGEAAASFEAFWDAPSTVSISTRPPCGTREAREALATLSVAHTRGELARSPYAQVLHADPRVRQLLVGDTTLQWTSRWSFVSDDPIKGHLPVGGRSAVMKQLVPIMHAAEHRLRMISPYFVPGVHGTKELIARCTAGVEVEVLTNSLAANDVAAVHGGYASYRSTLLGGNVGLWEKKPLAHSPAGASAEFASSLHTKALVVDDSVLFVGSFNMDQRSQHLNTEQGVVVYDRELARQMTSIFEQQIGGDLAWRVSLSQGRIQWNDGARTLTREPDAGRSKRLQAWLSRVLPVESQL